MDEKGLSTTHKAPQVVASVGTKPPAVTSSFHVLITVLGCDNALGYQVPPYFVFLARECDRSCLMVKQQGLIDLSETGWSNSDVFRESWKSPHEIFTRGKCHKSYSFIWWPQFSCEFWSYWLGKKWTHHFVCSTCSYEPYPPAYWYWLLWSFWVDLQSNGS